MTPEQREEVAAILRVFEDKSPRDLDVALDAIEQIFKPKLPPMPPTDDREEFGVGDYMESDNDWLRRNGEAAEWFIDNHAAIRSCIDGVSNSN
jgi:hypothetical protein